MERIKRMIDRPDTKSGRIFAWTVQVLIVVSLVSFSVETLPNLSGKSKVILSAIEILTVSIFSIEYLLRFFTAEKKLKFVFSFFGLIDLLAIVPFYVSAGVDLRAVRSFRLLRIVRILKLVRYSRAIRRFKIAFGLAKEELLLFTFVALIILYLSAVGIYYFEQEAQPQAFGSVFHSLWWGVTTLTTVGYGDVYPITIGGRIFTFFVLLVGLGIVAVPTGLIASALSRAREIERETSESEIE